MLLPVTESTWGPKNYSQPALGTFKDGHQPSKHTGSRAISPQASVCTSLTLVLNFCTAPSSNSVLRQKHTACARGKEEQSLSLSKDNYTRQES